MRANKRSEEARCDIQDRTPRCAIVLAASRAPSLLPRERFSPLPLLEPPATSVIGRFGRNSGAGVSRAREVGGEEGSVAGLVMVLTGLLNLFAAPLLVWML